MSFESVQAKIAIRKLKAQMAEAQQRPTMDELEAHVMDCLEGYQARYKTEAAYRDGAQGALAAMRHCFAAKTRAARDVAHPGEALDGARA